MRRPLAKISHEPLLPGFFRSQFEDLLFPQEIHRESACNAERKLLCRHALKIFRIVLEKESVAGLIKLDELPFGHRMPRTTAIFEVIHLSLQQRMLLKQLHHAEGSAAHGDNVHTPVGVALHHFQDFRRTTHMRHSFWQREKHAEFRFFLKAILDHLFVSRLKNMQGEGSAGEENDVQRKKRNALWPHDSHTK